MQPYTYYLYHKPTATHYYGVRTAKDCSPNELWKTYFSTSKIVKSLREQYGDNSFDYEVRKLFETAEEALEWERKVLTRIDAAGREDWLNRHNGGDKFTTVNQSAWNKGKPHPDSVRKKIAETRKKYVGEKHPMYGRKHSDQSKQKMSQNRVLLTGETNPFYGKKHSEELKKLISEHNKGIPSPRKGIKLTDEDKKLRNERLSKLPKMKCPHCNKEGTSSWMKRTHFNNCKLFVLDNLSKTD